ncbi:MAG: ADP-ribosylglycohydrolase family protein [Deltaproteobacteria bacterium]|nr:ADP-ribosylglycohydrolase family protein [Deltaproteobacteria bacterium]
MNSSDVINTTHQVQLQARFVGAALGTFVGDTLGMPVEGWSRKRIKERFGWLTDLQPGRLPAGHYTDDTEMMIGLWETLVSCGNLDPAVAAANFLRNYHPERGYGGRIQGVMTRLAQGADWQDVGTDSFGNGSAMRVAPVGCFFSRNLDLVKHKALISCEITHKHPQARAGAVAAAVATAMALEAGMSGRTKNPETFLPVIIELIRGLDEPSAQKMAALSDIQGGDPASLAEQITRMYRCNVMSMEAVPPALASFWYTDSFSDAVLLAVNLGGDTDTIGAMAGAVAGAYYGVSSIPEEWLAGLENGPKGRDYVIDLATRAVTMSWSATVPQV